MLHLEKYSDVLYHKIKEFIRSKGNVESISRNMGYADIDFRCYSKDIIEFYTLISELRNVFLGNVVQVDSMPLFSWEKISYYPEK